MAKDSAKTLHTNLVGKIARIRDDYAYPGRNDWIGKLYERNVDLEIVVVDKDPEGSLRATVRTVDDGALHALYLNALRIADTLTVGGKTYPVETVVSDVMDEPAPPRARVVTVEAVRAEYEKCRAKWGGASEPAALETLERLFAGDIL